MKNNLLKLLTLIMVLCFSLGTLFACSNGGSGQTPPTNPPEHTHSFTERVTEEEYLYSSATCTKKAEYYYSCSCGEKGTETFEFGEVASHSYGVENKCVLCGLEEVYSKGLEYELVGNGYAVKGIGNCEDAEIIIPSIYNGKPVTKILRGEEQGGSFYENKNITSIVLGSNVVEIEELAFYGCSNLTKVELNEGLELLGIGAFTGTAITTINIPNSVKDIHYNNIDYRYISAFSNCNNLIYNEKDGIKYLGNEENPYLWLMNVEEDVVDVIIDENCKHIFFGGESVWSGESVKTIQLPENVLSIDFDEYASYLLKKLQGNVENGLNYWGSKSNKYLYLNGAISEDITSATINNNCKIIGERAFLGCESLKSIVLGDSVEVIDFAAFSTCKSLTSIEIPKSVKVIGDGAFYCCESLASVVLGDSVEVIGRRAFYYCTSLTSIEISNNVKEIGRRAFSYCTSLTSINIPNSVTSIGNDAFRESSLLTSIEIPNSVTSIGHYAFSDCSSLTSITVDENNKNYKSIDGNLYSKDGKTLIQYAIGKTQTSFTIPSGVETIGECAFENCRPLTSVVIPNSVTSIGYSAFRDCTSLTNIEIPNSVTSIGSVAFDGCSSLTSIVIPNSVTSIGYSAFDGCSSLTSVVIPNSVTSIGSSAFSYCDSLQFNEYGDCMYLGSKDNPYFALVKTTNKNLTTYTIHNNTKIIADDAFYRCDSLTSIEIPNSVMSIGDSAFSSCDSLTSIEIPDSVTSIGDYAFRFCTSLTSIEIPNSVTSIGDCVFEDCSSLTSIEIPNSVTSIGDSAFSSCDSLTSIEIPDSVTSIGDWAFSTCSSLTSIKFNGTVSEWEKVIKGNSWNNNVPATEVVCTDGSVALK